jgi:UPF0755 protein
VGKDWEWNVSDREPKPARKNGLRLRAEERRKLLRIRLLVGAIAAFMIVGAAIRSAFQPVGEGRPRVTVSVERGAGVSAIGETLAQNGVIRSAPAFQFYVRWHGAGSRLRAGRYTLSGNMSLARILHLLEQGPGHGGGGRLRVTVPEGFTLAQIADALETGGICDASAFREFAAKPAAWTGFDVGFILPQSTLEGYLYPDTYDFLPHSTPEEIAKEMLLNFSHRFARPKQQEIAVSGHSLHEIVTLASLIEREARIPADRPRIAGVLENRLKKGMKLEIDATVLYALGYHKDRVYYKDLEVDSPYNTYRNVGLPPGPIANPGMASLDAALHPEANDYLFYVAQPNGAHVFSRTREDHEAAIRKIRAAHKVQKGGTP